MQVVIVSPLMRALETAAGAFGDGPFKGSGRPLMLAQTPEADERAGHCAVACPEGIPFIAFEGCRERLGVPLMPYFVMVMKRNLFGCKVEVSDCPTRPGLLLIALGEGHLPLVVWTQMSE